MSGVVVDLPSPTSIFAEHICVIHICRLNSVRDALNLPTILQLSVDSVFFNVVYTRNTACANIELVEEHTEVDLYR